MTDLADQPNPWILPLDSEQASLPLVGGKGLNLARLARSGLQVPPGFLATTQAYRDYVEANRLEARILALLQPVEADNVAALEAASAQIRALFQPGGLPAPLAEALRQAYRRYNHQAVAVRSSATAEDLPDMSFAGQQDTYLNVLGEESLLQAVVNCWGSLWTARAIGYRLRNRVSNHGVALAVVVQDMVQSEASGVLFTANPLTGLRAETVIDATLGLGEALVSGQVEPDHYVVAQGGEILSKTLGAKAVAIRGLAEGGTVTDHLQGAAVQAMPDEQIRALAQLGGQIEALYAAPQDIEWALADGQLYVLQSRAITSLFPTPKGFPPAPLQVFLSFGAVQGLLDPLTPLGMDALKTLFASGALMFGVHVTAQTQGALFEAGARLWLNVTPVITNSTGRRIMDTVLGMAEPTIRQATRQIKDEPALQPARQGISHPARLKLVRFMLPVMGNVLLNMLSPDTRRASIVNKSERLLDEVDLRCRSIQGDRWQKLAQLAVLFPEVAGSFLIKYFPLFISLVGAGVASWNFLNMLSSGAVKDQPQEVKDQVRDLVLQVTRGMPNNPTTAMDLQIWEMARSIRRDPAALHAMKTNPSSALADAYQAKALPAGLDTPVRQFMALYGARGLAEIDLGRSRWAEDPTHVFEVLTSFLQIENEAQAPDAVFARGAEAAGEAVTQLSERIKKQPGGWFKARLARFFAGRARRLMGARENPKFFAVRLLFSVRQALLQVGQEFVRAGELARPDDLCYLTFAELQAFAARQPGDWNGLIEERRAAFQRETLRRQVPRLLLSDGRAFYEGLSGSEQAPDGTGVIVGSPVSPGKAEGRVRVVFDPSQAGLLPGEILVCPGTDPSWTPLFLSAGGLVMEVGGMMTHGAVVAREYGIPAIVGVDQATTRLKTGQLVRMDGSSGQVVVLE